MLNALPNELYLRVAHFCNERSLRTLEHVDHKARTVSMHEQLKRYGADLLLLDPNVFFAYQKQSGNLLAPLKAVQKRSGHKFATVADKGAWKKALTARAITALGPPAFSAAMYMVTKPSTILDHLGRDALTHVFLSAFISNAGPTSARYEFSDRLAAQLRHPAPHGPWATIVGATLGYALHMSIAYSLKHLPGACYHCGELGLMFGNFGLLGGAVMGLEIDEERRPRTPEHKRRALHDLYTLRDHMHAYAEQGRGDQAMKCLQHGIAADMPDNDGVTALQKLYAAKDPRGTQAFEEATAKARDRKPALHKRRDARYRNYKERLLYAGVGIAGVLLALPLGHLVKDNQPRTAPYPKIVSPEVACTLKQSFASTNSSPE